MVGASHLIAAGSTAEPGEFSGFARTACTVLINCGLAVWCFYLVPLKGTDVQQAAITSG